jgi:hypothetical protein
MIPRRICARAWPGKAPWWLPWLAAASALMFALEVASAPRRLSPGNTESG